MPKFNTGRWLCTLTPTNRYELPPLVSFLGCRSNQFLLNYSLLEVAGIGLLLLYLQLFLFHCPKNGHFIDSTIKFVRFLDMNGWSRNIWANLLQRIDDQSNGHNCERYIVQPVYLWVHAWNMLAYSVTHYNLVQVCGRIFHLLVIE